MKMNRDGFDERQRAIRNKIGHQSFIMLYWLLLVEMSLSGFGVKWVAYPANIMIILTVCMIIYLVRLIMSNSYLSPDAQKARPAVSVMAAVVLAAALAAVLAVSIGKTFFGDAGSAGAAEDYSALILMMTSAVGLIIVGVVSPIKKRGDREE